MKLNNAKIIDLSEDVIDENSIEYNGEYYELYKKDCISQQAYNEGYKLIVQVNKERTKILKILTK